LGGCSEILLERAWMVRAGNFAKGAGSFAADKAAVWGEMSQ